MSNCVMCRLYDRARQVISNGIYSVGEHQRIMFPEPVTLGIGEFLVVEVDANGAVRTEVKPMENKHEEFN